MRVNEIYETYKDRVGFFLIYIREAHPSDGWQTPQNLYDEVVYEAPRTDDERADIATACQINLDIRLPTLMDGISAFKQRTHWEIASCRYTSDFTLLLKVGKA